MLDLKCLLNFSQAMTQHFCNLANSQVRNSFKLLSRFLSLTKKKKEKKQVCMKLLKGTNNETLTPQHTHNAFD